MVQQPKQFTEVVEQQRAQVSSQERVEAPLEQPQVLDLSVLGQIGGGSVETPGKGW
ncbi:hypothetical protein [Caldimonas sp. KR1-144]|uniref:hypothetical protein n=1 Tax=Caldimonas sp. KR1-144 TaxID=3400911 RepID=UPI003C08C668